MKVRFAYFGFSSGATLDKRKAWVLSLSGPAEATKPKFLDEIRQLMRLRHYSRRTEEAYTDWRVKAAPTR